jgi:NADPH:quinone reductase-like Zn-dependent oxidoreductase
MSGQRTSVCSPRPGGLRSSHGWSAGEISVKLERTFPLERASEALEESRIGHVRGKIVLLVD